MSRPPKPLSPRAKVKRGRLPFGPLYDELCAHQLRTANEIGEFYGKSPHVVRRWASQGVATYTADRLAVKLKLLPVIVWGDAFFDEDLIAAELAGGGRRRAFTDDDVRAVRARYAAGETSQAIADDYGVRYQSVLQVVKGNAYRNVA